jgi:hypothetical protein
MQFTSKRHWFFSHDSMLKPENENRALRNLSREKVRRKGSHYLEVAHPFFRRKLKQHEKVEKLRRPAMQGSKLYDSSDATSAFQSPPVKKKKKDSDTPSPFQCLVSSVLPSAMTRDQKMNFDGAPR